MSKIELNIIVQHLPDGQALPKIILWEDGRKFAIDKILDIRKAAALKCGGVGTRYICRICGKELTIFDEDGNQVKTTSLKGGIGFQEGTLDEMTAQIQDWMRNEAGLSDAIVRINENGKFEISTEDRKYDFEGLAFSVEGSKYKVINYDRTINMRLFRKNELGIGRVYTSYFTEMSEDSLMEIEYDVIAGKRPSKYNEVALLVDTYNTISSSVLNSIGIYSEVDSYTFEEILGQTYKLIDNNNYYFYNEDKGIYDTYNKKMTIPELYETGETITITAIMRENPNCSYDLYKSGIIYTKDLTDYVYGNPFSIIGVFDAGVNFALNDITLTLNNTERLSNAIIVNTTSGFSFNIAGGVLHTGKYNLTATSTNFNYKINYINNEFNITKRTIEIYQIDDIVIVYGNNYTVVVTGKYNTTQYGDNYDGLLNVSLKIGDKLYKNNNTVHVSSDGTFKVGISVVDLGAQNYTISVEGASTADYNNVSMSKNLTAYLNITKAVVSANYTSEVSVVYGMNGTIDVEGTFNVSSADYAVPYRSLLHSVFPQ